MPPTQLRRPPSTSAPGLGSPPPHPTQASPFSRWCLAVAGGGAAFGFGWAIFAVLIGAIIGLAPTRAHAHARTPLRILLPIQNSSHPLGLAHGAAAACGAPRAAVCVHCVQCAVGQRRRHCRFRTGQSIAFTIGRYALRDFVTAQIERFPRWKQASVLTEA